MNELEILILCVSEENNRINEIWKKHPHYKDLNMSKNLVCDLYNDPEKLSTIFIYRNFILDSNFNPSLLFSDLNLNNKVFSRIKTINSIQYKIENYYKNHQQGKIPINKCLNDLIGIRIILEEDVTLSQISEWIKKEFPELKVIPAYRNEYKAIHVYFGKGNSYLFQWELQIWLKKDSSTNLASHREYKQEYVKWEQNN